MATISNEKLIEWTVELTKAYFGNTDLNCKAADVADFLQIVYDKLAELKSNGD